MRRSTCTGMAMVVMLASSARANVSERNGNFFIGYTDIDKYPGFGLSLERVYNSKSSYWGMFGLGWGSDYEVYLTPQPDGSVVLHENGGGSDTAFQPAKLDDAAIAALVKALVAARKTAGDLDAERLAAYGQRVATDERFRHDEAQRLAGTAKLPPVDVAVGAKLVATKWTYAELTRTETGYELAQGERTWEFSTQGKARRVHDRNGHWVEIDYDGNGRIRRLRDDLKHWIQLDLDGSGHVLRAVTGDGQISRYRWSEGRMVTSIDAANNRYDYAWDDRSNLIRVGYADGTEMVIAYDPMERNEGVRFVKERDGSTTVYERRGSGDPDALEYGLRVEHRGPDGQITSERSDFFTDKLKANGSGRYLYREDKDEDGSKLSTTYTEDGKPLEVVENGERTAYRYDDKGRKTYSEDPNGSQELVYGELGKVTHVKRTRHGVGGDTTFEATYSYDGHANLIEAVTSDGGHITLTYDKGGRIATIKSDGGTTPRRELKFQYDPVLWKPNRITAVGVGTLDVTYDDDGEVQSTDSRSGPQVAYQVSAVLQELLDAVRPAGVGL